MNPRFVTLSLQPRSLGYITQVIEEWGILLKNIYGHAVTLLGLLGLCACGGGGSGGSSGEAAVVVPPITSTPTPTPAPSASPSPAPVATRFAIAGVGPMAATILFDVDPDMSQPFRSDASTYTALDGTYGRDIVPEYPNRVSGSVPSMPTALMMTIGGIDRTTGFRFRFMTAPVGATVVSPLSTLIVAHGDEAAVRAGFGLDAGDEALRTKLSLLTFDPSAGLKSSDPAVVHDAARLTSINLQLLALGSLLRYFAGDPTDASFDLDLPSRNLATVLRETGSLRTADKNVLRAAFRNSPRGQGHPDGPQLDRILETLAAYFRAVPPLLSDEAEIRGWAYAFNFYVQPELGDPWFQSMLTPVITEAEIHQSQRVFAAAPKPAVRDPFMGATDYLELSQAYPTGWRTTLSNCVSKYERLPTCNDGLNPLPGQPYEKAARVTAVRDLDPAALTVTITPSDTIELARVGTYSGLTWFTYTAVDNFGAEVTGRVYVRVRPPH